MSDNITKLAKTINKRIQQVSSGKVAVYCELGEIVSGKALKVSSLDDKIPKKEYSVLGFDFKLTDNTQIQLRRGTISDTYTLEVNGKELSLESNYKNGDDVLVVWASGEPIVVGKVV